MTFLRKALLCLLVLTPSASFSFDSIQLRRTLNPLSLRGFEPAGLAVDSTGRLWVCDPGRHQLQIYSEFGEWKGSLGDKGSAGAQLLEPRGIARGLSGRLYVADTGNHRIQIVSEEGKFVSSFGEKGSGPGQFKHPISVSVAADGIVAVAERDEPRVQLFSADGVFLRSFITNGPVETIDFEPAGTLLVVHQKAKQIERWSAAGQQMNAWNGAEPGVKGFSKPAAAAASPSGLLYVADAGANQFRELDAQGRTIGTFGRSGTGEGQFKSLAGIAAEGEMVYVSDARNRRVLVFALSRQVPLGAAAAVPTTRLQVSRASEIVFDADRVAAGNDGSWHALSAERGELVTFNAAGQQAGTIDLRKSIGIRKPSGLAAAPASGNLFVADEGADRIVKLDRQGAVLLEVGKSSRTFRRGEGDLRSPGGLACSAQGVLLVTDNGRVQAFNHQGLFQFAAKEKGEGAGQMKTPVSVAWDKDRFYVVDAGNRKVLAMNASGRFLHELAAAGGEALADPRDIAVGHDGTVFLLDAERSRVLIYDAQGLYLGAFGAPGRHAGYFAKPRSLAVNENGDLAVADEGRVQIFRTSVLPSAPTGLAASPGEGFVALKWDPVKSRFPVKYVVYRSTGAGLQRLRDTLETSFSDDTLPAATTSTYRVAAESVQGAVGAFSIAVDAMAKAVTGPRLEITKTDIQDVFSAHYKYYGRVPLGRVTIRNNGEAPVQKLKVSFAVQGYMDFPTEMTIDEIRSGQEKEVALLATLNNRILEVTETTPMQAQVKLSFMRGDQENSVVKHLPFKLYSRNSIRWEEKERLAAFITPNDPPVIDFARKVVTPFAEAHRGAPMPSAMLTAWALFEGLGTHGMTYLPRPNNPYDRVSLDSTTVDTLQFARETLSRKSGDCADVVALLASALESMTVTTVALDAPGHLFLMFDTGESQKELLGFPEDRLVQYAGTYWIPLEATLLGSSFTEAWKQGAEQYQRWAKQGKIATIDVHRAWRNFEPATLPDIGSGVVPPAREAIEEKFASDWKALVELRWKTMTEAIEKAEGKDSPAAALKLGLLAAEFRRYDEAETFFTKAASDLGLAASAYNNLGNLAFMKDDLPLAVSHYQQAQDRDGSDPGTALNLARAYYKMPRPELATRAFERAMTLDPSLRETYPDVSVLVP
jgi:DNA-binding beta-propeller fold protein YncE